MDIRNISMYFGYDAKPMSIFNINTNTVPGWPDNRIYDVFIDAYKNVMAATHSGLAYYNIATNSVELVELTPNQTNFVVRAIEFLKNGVWVVGTNTNTFYSYDGGQNWKTIGIPNVNSITSDNQGRAVIGTDQGIYIIRMNFEALLVNGTITQGNIHEEPILIDHLTSSDNTTDDRVKVVKVDESDVIWAGTDSGVIRIENYINKTVANISNGMRSSQVTDICIIDRGTRYVATVTGLEKMTGFKFDHINVLNHDITSDNILSVTYSSQTNSLWFSSANKLYEIVFRDIQHEAIVDELVEYDSELILNESLNNLTHYILGIESIVGDNFDLASESTKVLVNKNIIDFIKEY